jgi:hypothetical protein
LLCCTTQPRDALCERVTLFAPDDVNKLLFAERDLWNMTAAIIPA